MDKCRTCSLHDIRGIKVCRDRKCPVEGKYMKKWRFSRIEGDTGIVGVITPTAKDARDTELSKQFGSLEFGYGEKEKVIVIDRRHIRDEYPFATVVINEMGCPQWETRVLIQDGKPGIEKFECYAYMAVVMNKMGCPESKTRVLVPNSKAEMERLERYARIASLPKFTWGDREDPEVFTNGVTILWADAKKKRMQSFVEALSNKVGAKADWSYSGGRAHVDIMPEGAAKAMELIEDDGFMGQFLKPYDEDPEDYFVVLSTRGDL